MKSHGNKLFMNLLKTLHVVSVVSTAGGLLCMLAILLTRDMGAFTGVEIVYDKITLGIFNTAVLYGAFLMIATVFLYSCFTEWGFFKYRFIIIKWVLLLAVFLVAYFGIGSAVSGMASISDAGLHMEDMAAQYRSLRTQALWGLAAEAVLFVLVIFVSIRKPFGKRETKPFKYRKITTIAVIALAAIGIFILLRNQSRILQVRNMPIEEVSLAEIADGEYDGVAELSNGTVSVRVTVKDRKITEIVDTNPRNSIYAKYARGVFKKIILKQTPNVDAVTGATTSSKGYMKAVENALGAEK